ncbi:MAG: response regulator [Chloroflexota bacterium]
MLDRAQCTRRRVLVVEDDPGIRSLLTCILEMDGYEVVTAVDGIDGWQRMKEAPAAVVITDFLLPRLDGLDFARRLRAAFGTATKIVVVSSLRAAHRRVLAENVADVFLRKPVDVPNLRRVIAALWDSSGSGIG